MNRTAKLVLGGLLLFVAGGAVVGLADRTVLLPPAPEAPTTATAPAAPTGPAPTDVKQYGDWTVRCIPGGRPPCEMIQIARNKQGRRVSSVALAYLPRVDRHALRIDMPLGVSLSQGVKITASKFAAQPMPFARCDGAGCVAQGNVETGALDSLAGSDPDAKLEAAAVNGQAVTLPLSLRGFADARAAMETLAKQKVADAKP